MSLAVTAPRIRSGEPVVARVTAWLRRNLFSSPVNTLLTVLVAGFLWLTLPPIYEWAVGGATLAGSSKAACAGDGACWTFTRCFRCSPACCWSEAFWVCPM